MNKMNCVAADITLENIDDFFTIGKRVSNVDVISTSSGKPQNQPPKPFKEDPFIPPYKRHARVNNPSQTHYAVHYQQKELLENSQAHQQHDESMDSVASLVRPPPSVRSRRMEDLDVESITTGIASVSLPDTTMAPDEAAHIYRDYNFDHTYDPNLTITSFREQIINTVETNSVTVIQGPTGSGKTTQVPQYILDNAVKQRQYCNIVVTQPRRIAAISIARRVWTERKWPPATLCGYQIGLERNISDDTRITYCTTGVLLRKLIKAKDMQMYTHVILDEVHERDQDSDFCLLVVKKLLRTNSRNVKVVLMSATFNTEEFAHYFSVPVMGRMHPAPVVDVEGRQYKVSEFYLEDLKELGELPRLRPDEAGIRPESYHIVRCLIMGFDQLEKKEQGQQATGYAEKRGSILVFLPGMGEINEMRDELRRIETTHHLWILPLHSNITIDEQRLVFEPPKAPKKKKVPTATLR